MRHRSFVLSLVAGLILLLSSLLVGVPVEASPDGWQTDPGGRIEHVWEAVSDWWSGWVFDTAEGARVSHPASLGPTMDPDGSDSSFEDSPRLGPGMDPDG